MITSSKMLYLPIEELNKEHFDNKLSLSKISDEYFKHVKNVIKTFSKNKEVASVLIDPYKETADIDEKNNSWNMKETPNRFDVFKSKTVGRGQSTGGNPMQKTK